MNDKKPDLSFLYVFDSLCYPTNDSEDLGKWNAKADIGIFVGYAPTKKAFRIYNMRTQKIMETIHDSFQTLFLKTCNPPKRDDLDRLFQPMFDEYFNPPPVAINPAPVAVAPRAINLADSPMSTSIDQDTPSISIPSAQEQDPSLIISQGVKESLKTPHFNDDLSHPQIGSRPICCPEA
ncbi:retrovirus-related pol polyprotein from transposon TNT 1-94 [Tanacetum coccineum]